jgi:hypothetical protein
MTIPASFADPFVYNSPDTNGAPYYFFTDTQLVLVSAVCLNCKLFGGTTIRPPFMPD